MKKKMLLGLAMGLFMFGMSDMASASLVDGLVAYYPLNGNALDASGNGNNGIVYGATPTIDRFGNTNGAYSFDGVNNYIDLGNDSSLNPKNEITLAAWYKPVSFVGVGNNPIIDKGYFSHTYPNYQYHLGVTGDGYRNTPGEFGFSVSDGNDSYRSGTEPNYWEAGQWYHIAGTFDGSEVIFYVNGELIDSVSASGAMVDYGKNAYIGTFSNVNSFTPGVIDEVRFYNRVLSETEIQQLATVPIPGAVWLFGTGLLALFGSKRRLKK